MHLCVFHEYQLVRVFVSSRRCVSLLLALFGGSFLCALARLLDHHLLKPPGKHEHVSSSDKLQLQNQQGRVNQNSLISANGS